MRPLGAGGRARGELLPWFSVGFLVVKNLVQAQNAPQDQSHHPRARNDYDEEAAYGSYMNPEPGFQSGPGDSVDAD